MRISLGVLRRILLREIGGDNLARIEGPNILDPDVNNEKWPGVMNAKAFDTVGDEDEMPEHLKEPNESPEDCWGPVPPVAEDPYVQLDPYVTDFVPMSGGM